MDIIGCIGLLVGNVRLLVGYARLLVGWFNTKHGSTFIGVFLCQYSGLGEKSTGRAYRLVAPSLPQSLELNSVFWKDVGQSRRIFLEGRTASGGADQCEGDCGRS